MVFFTIYSNFTPHTRIYFCKAENFLLNWNLLFQFTSEFGYRLTQKAESDLDGIVSYIAVELSNPPAASDFVNKLQENIEEARNFPESGSLIYNDFLQAENVRKKLVGHYIMYYLPDTGEKIIYILRIVYSKRNMDEILKELDV